MKLVAVLVCLGLMISVQPVFAETLLLTQTKQPPHSEYFSIPEGISVTLTTPSTATISYSCYDHNSGQNSTKFSNYIVYPEIPVLLRADPDLQCTVELKWGYLYITGKGLSQD